MWKINVTGPRNNEVTVQSGKILGDLVKATGKGAAELGDAVNKEIGVIGKYVEERGPKVSVGHDGDTTTINFKAGHIAGDVLKGLKKGAVEIGDAVSKEVGVIGKYVEERGPKVSVSHDGGTTTINFKAGHIAGDVLSGLKKDAVEIGDAVRQSVKTAEKYFHDRGPQVTVTHGKNTIG